MYQPFIERTESLSGAVAFTLDLKVNFSEMISPIGMIYNDIYIRIAQGLLSIVKNLSTRKLKDNEVV